MAFTSKPAAGVASVPGTEILGPHRQSPLSLSMSKKEIVCAIFKTKNGWLGLLVEYGVGIIVLVEIFLFQILTLGLVIESYVLLLGVTSIRKSTTYFQLPSFLLKTPAMSLHHANIIYCYTPPPLFSDNHKKNSGKGLAVGTLLPTATSV